MFLDLPKLSPRLQEYITATSALGGWSSNCVQVGGLALHLHLTRVCCGVLGVREVQKGVESFERCGILVNGMKKGAWGLDLVASC